MRIVNKYTLTGFGAIRHGDIGKNVQHCVKPQSAFEVLTLTMDNHLYFVWSWTN